MILCDGHLDVYLAIKNNSGANSELLCKTIAEL